MVAPFLGAYDLDRVADIRLVWRPFYAMVIAAPLAGWLRGLWLGQPIIPLFVFVLGGISSLAVLAWRAIYCFIALRKITEG